MKQKKLREARAELEMCARDACPRIARTDCRGWLADVVSEQPSIIIAAHEVRGTEVRDVRGVRAIIDGAIAVDSADATPVLIDPGPHRLRLERTGAEPLQQDIDVREGEKFRVVHVYWRAAAVMAPTSRETPPAVYALAALGVAAAGVGTYFEIAGLSKHGDLNAQCLPQRSCSQAQVDVARNLTLAGDLTLGAGILLLASASYLYFTRPVASTSLRDDHMTWTLARTPGGLAAGFQGSW